MSEHERRPVQLSKRYVVGIPDASEFRFWTAWGASRFLSKLNRALIGNHEWNGRAAPVYYRDPRTGWREVW